MRLSAKYTTASSIKADAHFRFVIPSRKSALLGQSEKQLLKEEDFSSTMGRTFLRALAWLAFFWSATLIEAQERDVGESFVSKFLHIGLFHILPYCSKLPRFCTDSFCCSLLNL